MLHIIPECEVDDLQGVLRYLCCQCVCECRGSLCGIFEQNVISSKDENSILWRKSHILKVRDFFMACVRSVISVIVHKTPNEFHCADNEMFAL